MKSVYCSKLSYNYLEKVITSAYGFFQQNLLNILVLARKLHFLYETVQLNDLNKAEGHPRADAMFESNASQMVMTKVHK